MSMVTKTNKMGDILFRLRNRFAQDGISSISRGKSFYDLHINKSTIINGLNNPDNEDDCCYRFNYEIPYDFSNFTSSDYLYIKAQLCADLSSDLKVYVNCTVNSLSRIIDGNEIHYIEIKTFIRKPPKG